jgi:hypothetical protein
MHGLDIELRRSLSRYTSPIVYTEDGWTMNGLSISNCPWCGDVLPLPNYQTARWDASPW